MATSRKKLNSIGKPNTTAGGELEEEELTQVTVELGPVDDDNQETEPFIKGQDAPPPPPKKPKTPQQKFMAVVFYWFVYHSLLFFC